MNSLPGALDAQSVSSSTFQVSGEDQAVVLPWIFAAAEVYYASRKVLGERAECAFLAEAMARGLIVSKPYGDSAPYDFIVEKRSHNHRGHRGHRGRLWKVQVKSARVLGRGATYQISSRRGGGRYRPGEIDFVAAWIVPLDAWYIVPAAEIIARTKAGFYPQVEGSRGKYEKYREAWGQLGTVDSE